jgi:hypothetical protein
VPLWQGSEHALAAMTTMATLLEMQTSRTREAHSTRRAIGVRIEAMRMPGATPSRDTT